MTARQRLLTWAAFFTVFVIPQIAAAQVLAPTNLPVGSQYQVLFVTQGPRDATSSNIEDYNAFVTAQAALNPALPQGVAWHAVGWTSTVNAQDNAPSTGLPVYDTRGALLIPAGVGLYSGWRPASYLRNQFGTPQGGYVWTGAMGPAPEYSSQTEGYLGDLTMIPDPFTGQLGYRGVTVGYATNASAPGFAIWLSNSRTGPDAPYSFLALSDPITVTSGLPQVSTGLRHSCTVQSAGTLSCWGDDTQGQASPPPGLFRQVSAGGEHTCAIADDWTVACWGDNSYFQSTPLPGTFTQVSAGLHNTCAIQTDGTPVCWGDNTYGQSSPPPGPVSEISAGDAFSCAIVPTNGGEVTCWGSQNYDGAFFQINPGGKFSHVSVGRSWACGISAATWLGQMGTCWGYGPNAFPPAPGGGWPGPEQWGIYSQLSVGATHACAVAVGQSGGSEDGSVPFGTVVCWGANTHGESTPPPGVFAQVSAGENHTCAVQTNGTLACWGDNTYGQSSLLPFARNDMLTTDEDMAAADMLTASNPLGSALTFSIVQNGTKGTAVITNAATGAYTYTPNNNATDADAFTFKVNDGAIDSNVATVTVTITPVNDPPVATDGVASVLPGAAVNGTLLASDVDGPSLTFSIVSNGGKGTAVMTNSATGAYTYTANAGVSGTDSFTFKTNDGSLDSNVATVVVTITRPDLIVSALTNPPATTAPGGSLTINDTTQNQGAVNAAASTTRYYFSLDQTRSAGDILLTATRAVPLLGPGASSAGAALAKVPATVALDTYWLLACADDRLQVTEANEGNNCRASTTTVVVGRPDLVETTLTGAPAVIAPGGRFAVSDTAKNQGTAASVPTANRYYLSLDTIKDNTDVLLTGSRNVAALEPNATSSGAANLTVPGITPEQTYVLLACADDLAKATELNEANNCIASSTTVQVALPDLVETSLANPPAGAVPGGKFSVSDTVQNVGSGPAGTTQTRYYLSLDTTKGAGDVLLTGLRSVVALAGGATSSGGANLTVPAGTPFASYFVLACADDTVRTVESNEGNNCRASATTISIHP